MILSEIERLKRQEQWVRNENAIAEQLRIPEVPLSDTDKALLGPFVEWCRQIRVRPAPARPHVVASFIADMHAKNQGVNLITKMIAAIEALHDLHGLANPVATGIVRTTLDRMLKIEPPRSWPKSEQAIFSQLPAELRAIIARREREREKELRRLQNEVAELKRQTQTAAETKAVNKPNEETENGKQGIMEEGRGSVQQEQRPESPAPRTGERQAH